MKLFIDNNELANRADLNNAYPGVQNNAIDSNFNLDSHFEGWRKGTSGSIPQNAPEGIIDTAFYCQMHQNQIDYDTRIEIALGLGSIQNDGSVTPPHIWIRNKGWNKWSNWAQII